MVTQSSKSEWLYDFLTKHVDWDLINDKDIEFSPKGAVIVVKSVMSIIKYEVWDGQKRISLEWKGIKVSLRENDDVWNLSRLKYIIEKDYKNKICDEVFRVGYDKQESLERVLGSIGDEHIRHICWSMSDSRVMCYVLGVGFGNYSQDSEPTIEVEITPDYAIDIMINKMVTFRVFVLDIDLIIDKIKETLEQWAMKHWK